MDNIEELSRDLSKEQTEILNKIIMKLNQKQVPITNNDLIYKEVQ